MTTELLTATAADRVRIAIGRASDFFGAPDPWLPETEDPGWREAPVLRLPCPPMPARTRHPYQGSPAVVAACLSLNPPAIFHH